MIKAATFLLLLLLLHLKPAPNCRELELELGKCARRAIRCIVVLDFSDMGGGKCLRASANTERGGGDEGGTVAKIPSSFFLSCCALSRKGGVEEQAILLSAKNGRRPTKSTLQNSQIYRIFRCAFSAFRLLCMLTESEAGWFSIFCWLLSSPPLSPAAANADSSFIRKLFLPLPTFLLYAHS